MTTKKRCVICNKVILETFYVCMECLLEHELPFKYRDWPRWLKDLCNMEQKHLAIEREEEPYLSYEIISECYPDGGF